MCGRELPEYWHSVPLVRSIRLDGVTEKRMANARRASLEHPDPVLRVTCSDMAGYLSLRQMAFPSFQRLLSTSRLAHTQDFTFWPQFFTAREQTLLLFAALQKLDRAESSIFRRRRKALGRSLTDQTLPEDLFLPDEYYDFQEVSSVYNVILSTKATP